MRSTVDPTRLGEVASVRELCDFEVEGHHGWRRVVLQLCRSIMLIQLVHLIAVFGAAKFLRDLVEVCYTTQTVGCVVRQADIEEAAVLLGDELVHVMAARPDQEEVTTIQGLLLALFGRDDGVGFDELLILVVRKLVVSKLRFDLVIGVVTELAEHELEVDAHVGMVMQRHLLTLFDEEEDEAVVVVGDDVDFVQGVPEMILVRTVIGALNSEFLQRN